MIDLYTAPTPNDNCAIARLSAALTAAKRTASRSPSQLWRSTTVVMAWPRNGDVAGTDGVTFIAAGRAGVSGHGNRKTGSGIGKSALGEALGDSSAHGAVAARDLFADAKTGCLRTVVVEDKTTLDDAGRAGNRRQCGSNQA